MFEMEVALAGDVPTDEKVEVEIGYAGDRECEVHGDKPCTPENRKPVGIYTTAMSPELKFAMEKQRLESELGGAMVHVVRYENILKECKALAKERAEELEALTRTFENERPTESGDVYNEPTETEAAENQTASPQTGLSDPEPDPKPVDPDAWRSIPAAKLFEKGIARVGQKKIEAFLDLCTTIGEVEDLRAEAARANIPFKDKLPKGWGNAAVDAIEERLLTVLAENRPAEPEPTKADSGPITESAQTTGETALEAAVTSTVDDEARDPDPAHAEQVAKRVLELTDEVTCYVCEADPELLACGCSVCNSTGKRKGPSPPKMDETFQDGRRAYENGDDISDVSWSAGEQQDDWIKGWLAAATDAEPKEESVATASIDEL